MAKCGNPFKKPNKNLFLILHKYSDYNKSEPTKKLNNTSKDEFGST